MTQVIGSLIWILLTIFAWKKRGWGKKALRPLYVVFIMGFTIGLAKGQYTPVIVLINIALFTWLIVMCFKKGPKYIPRPKALS